MTFEQFCYWFQGFAELHDKPPTAAQWKSIKEHLATVFHKVTPPVTTVTSTEGTLADILKQSPWDPTTRIC